MVKKDIICQLYEKHKSLIDLTDTLSLKDYNTSKSGKWTPGQQLEHIYLSVRPITRVLQSLEFLIACNFGKADRESIGYDELVAVYRNQLKTITKTFERFEPRSPKLINKEELSQKILLTVEELCANLEKFTEHDLDGYFIPHPLLKNLTVREMLHFTIYHTEHHHKLVVQNL